jgi:hypothetical protein
MESNRKMSFGCKFDSGMPSNTPKSVTLPDSGDSGDSGKSKDLFCICEKNICSKMRKLPLTLLTLGLALCDHIITILPKLS